MSELVLIWEEEDEINVPITLSVFRDNLIWRSISCGANSELDVHFLFFLITSVSP